MNEVARVSIDKNLQPFSEWLRRQGVEHRISELGGELVLELQRLENKDQVLEALNSYLEHPELEQQLSAANAASSPLKVRFSAGYDRVTPQQAPLVFIVISLCVLVAWLTDLGGGGEVLRALLIVNPFDISMNLNSIEGRWSALVETMQSGEIWRLFSPDVLHFSLLHIVFNLLMFWILGGQLEYRKGALALFVLIVVVSVISNVAQLLDGGYLFGGLSGVVYGLFGYTRVWSHYDRRVFMPDGLFKFALVWLVIGYTPLTEWIGLGAMANSAHLYGLLSGLVLGWLVFGLTAKRNSAS